MKHIVVIGGGFAGINFIEHLREDDSYMVTLVDRNNYNFFPPLLYQIATGYLEVSNISYPFRKLLRHLENVRFHMGEVLEILPFENRIRLSTGDLTYDYLILATGAETNYFGMENLQRNSLPMKTVNDALELRNHILKQIELAAISHSESHRTRLLNIVVAGGGPTGVEISGMLSEMRRYILPRDYPEISDKDYAIHIYLVDAVDAVLKPMSVKSQADTFRALTRMGVEVRLGLQVKDYVDGEVVFADGQRIATNTLIWAAGVRGSVFKGMPGECYGRGGRLIVDDYNKVECVNNIYAIGDTCIQAHEAKWPNGHPQVAQVAIQQGRTLAKNLTALSKGQLLHKFAYNDKGSMAIIGRNKAVVDMPGGTHFRGFTAWFLWLFIHLISLVRGRNRITTLYNWVISYFTKDQSLRMIIRPTKQP